MSEAYVKEVKRNKASIWKSGRMNEELCEFAARAKKHGLSYGQYVMFGFFGEEYIKRMRKLYGVDDSATDKRKLKETLDFIRKDNKYKDPFKYKREQM